MTDDIARQRFWSENNVKPSPAKARPRGSASRSRGRSLRVAVEPTHVLMVRLAGHRKWSVVADHGDVSGSEAFCNAEIATRARHFPTSEFRVMTWPEDRKELRRKTWSVNDEDHIAAGERVMLAVTPVQLHPEIAKISEVFGMPSDDQHRRTGVVRRRWHRTGEYMVKIDGSGLQVSVKREDLIYPVPDNLVEFKRRSSP